MSFRSAIEEFRSDPEDPVLMAMVIERASSADDRGIARLAQILAESGRVVERRAGTCDVASTGGPTSLSTLISPLFLRALGFVVPKVGVPGRPAGAIDVLATIPGFRIDLNHSSFEKTLAKIGFCHALAGDDLAPLDGVLFQKRKAVGAVNIAPLVIASLLSKKIAVGLERVVIDVRVWKHGNLGRSSAGARQRSERFCRVADLVGIKAVCVLTDATLPYQPFIGRGESLLALAAALYGDPEPWLAEHLTLCFHIAAQALDKPQTCPSRRKLRRAFEAHLEGQGSSVGAFLERVATINSEQATVLRAQSEGFLKPDLLRLRSIIVKQQEEAASQEEIYSDPVGVRLLVRPETSVKPGTPIARLRRMTLESSAVTDDIREVLRIVREAPSLRIAPVTIRSGS